MGFGWYVFIGFLVFCGVFLLKALGDARKAGKDSVISEQGKAASRARRDAQEAESRVDGMSDDDAIDRLRDNWSRD